MSFIASAEIIRACWNGIYQSARDVWRSLQELNRTRGWLSLDPARRCAACQEALLFTSPKLTDPEIDRAELIGDMGRRLDGTCEWIKKNDLYNSWLHGDRKLLWICGGPGKGKTTLSTFLTQELEKDMQTIYYFCSVKYERRNNATSILRALLWQLVTKQPELPEHLLQYFEDFEETETLEKTRTVLSSRETLWTMLMKLVRDAKLNETSCLLDGLDACDKDSKEWLTTKLFNIRLKGGWHALRFLIVSRDICEVRTTIQPSLDSDYNEQTGTDIHWFVATKVQEVSRRFESSEKQFQEHIKETLLKRAEGNMGRAGNERAYQERYLERSDRYSSLFAKRSFRGLQSYATAD